MLGVDARDTLRIPPPPGGRFLPAGAGRAETIAASVALTGMAPPGPLAVAPTDATTAHRQGGVALASTVTLATARARGVVEEVVVDDIHHDLLEHQVPPREATGAAIPGPCRKAAFRVCCWAAEAGSEAMVSLEGPDLDHDHPGRPPGRGA